MSDMVKTGIQQDLQHDLQQGKGKNKELNHKLSSSTSDINYDRGWNLNSYFIFYLLNVYLKRKMPVVLGF